SETISTGDGGLAPPGGAPPEARAGGVPSPQAMVEISERNATARSVRIAGVGCVLGSNRGLTRSAPVVRSIRFARIRPSRMDHQRLWGTTDEVRSRSRSK